MDGPPLQLQASLLREQVTNALREAIVTMRLKPGQKLVERDLIAWTGVSRATVRESIRQLVAERLVETIPQKGTFVATPTLREAEEVYDLRALVEGLVARQFVERASAAEVRALRRKFEAIKRIAMTTGDTWSILQAKSEFYDVLLRGAANQTVKATLAGLQARITFLRATCLAQPGRLPQTIAEIEAIVGAIERGDAADAARVSTEHVHSSGRVALAALRAKGAENN